MKTFVNFDIKATLTVIDPYELVKDIVDVFYVRSRYRTDSSTLKKMNMVPIDFLMKESIDNKYISDLYSYVHFYAKVPELIRLQNYYRSIPDNAWYSVTKEDFPKIQKGDFESLVDFIGSTHVSNLRDDLLPYTALPNQGIAVSCYDQDSLNKFCDYLRVKRIKAQ